MGTVFQGDLTVEGKKFGIVVSRFNEFISKRLLDGAMDRLVRSGASAAAIDVAWVPGSFEIPLVCKAMAAKKYDALIALGAVIRGETAHFDYVAGELAKGLSKVSLDTNVPMIFGVITAETLEQAIDRAGAKSGNKGAEAAATAIEMVNLLDNEKRAGGKR